MVENYFSRQIKKKKFQINSACFSSLVNNILLVFCFRQIVILALIKDIIFDSIIPEYKHGQITQEK